MLGTVQMSWATQEFPALPPTAAGPRPEAPPPPASRFTLRAVAAGHERHGDVERNAGAERGETSFSIRGTAARVETATTPLETRLGDLATRAWLISVISDPGPRLCARRTHLLRHRVARLARDIGWGLCYRRPLCLSSPIGPPPDPDTGGEGPALVALGRDGATKGGCGAGRSMQDGVTAPSAQGSARARGAVSPAAQQAVWPHTRLDKLNLGAGPRAPRAAQRAKRRSGRELDQSSRAGRVRSSAWRLPSTEVRVSFLADQGCGLAGVSDGVSLIQPLCLCLSRTSEGGMT
jgi:hypothetical protein